MTDQTVRTMAQSPYAFTYLVEMLDQLRANLQLAGYDGAPTADAATAVTKAKAILKRAHAKLERALWDVAEERPESFALDDAGDEPTILPIEVRTPQGRA